MGFNTWAMTKSEIIGGLYLFMLVPFSSRRGNKDPFVENSQINGTGRLDDVTNSVLP